MTIAYETRNTPASGSGAQSVGVPTGTVEGDFLLAMWMGLYSDDHSTGPAGWTKIGETTTGGATTSDSKISAWYKIASASESTWTWIDGGNHNFIMAMRFSGDDPQLGNFSTSNSSGASSTSHTFTSPTSTEDNSMLDVLAGWGQDGAQPLSSWANASLSSITQIWEQQTTSGAASTLAAAYGVDVTAGAIGNSTVTSTGSFPSGAVSVIIEETPAAGTDVSPGGRQTLGRQSAAVAATKLGGVLQ